MKAAAWTLSAVRYAQARAVARKDGSNTYTVIRKAAPHAAYVRNKLHILPEPIVTAMRGVDAELRIAEMASRMRIGLSSVKECP